MACAAALSHIPTVCCSLSMRPAARSSSGPAPGRAANSLTAASAAASTIPPQLAAVRSASRANQGCTESAPAQPELSQDRRVVENHPVRDRGAQARTPVPSLVDLDASRIGQVDPHRNGRPGMVLSGQDECTIEPAGTRTEGLDTSQNGAAGFDDHGRRWSLIRTRIASPHTGSEPVVPDRVELALAECRRGLDGQPFDRVEVTIEDPPDRSVRASGGPDEAQLSCGRRAIGTGLRVPGQNSRPLERVDRVVRERGAGSRSRSAAVAAIPARTGSNPRSRSPCAEWILSRLGRRFRRRRSCQRLQ